MQDLEEFDGRVGVLCLMHEEAVDDLGRGDGGIGGRFKPFHSLILVLLRGFDDKKDVGEAARFQSKLSKGERQRSLEACCHLLFMKSPVFDTGR